MNDGIDIGDLQEGFQVGKSIALAEWSFRKEQRDFEKLVDRLRSRKWWRTVKAEGGERYEKKKAQLRAQNKKTARRKKLNELQQERRLAAFRARGEMVTCPCGATWPKPRCVGQQRKYCSPKCARRAYRQKHKEALKAKRREYHANTKKQAPHEDGVSP